jgi:hypothetical protein
MDSRITVNGIEYVREDMLDKKDLATDPEGREFVIVRATGAGVHAGYLLEQTDTTVKLAASRRLWRWHGRTLSGLALEGTDDVSQCKFGDALPKITIAGWCEIIPCTEKARESLQSVPLWVND